MSSIHQEVEFEADSDRIYHALIDGQAFATFTAAGDAKIHPEPGRNLAVRQLHHGTQRRARAGAPSGLGMAIEDLGPRGLSIVRFELTPHGDRTTVTLDHTGYPDGEREHLDVGWAPDVLGTSQEIFVLDIAFRASARVAQTSESHQ